MRGRRLVGLLLFVAGIGLITVAGIGLAQGGTSAACTTCSNA